MVGIKNVILVFLILLFSVCVSYAQTPQPYRLETSDDFSVKTIYEFLEDKITHDIWIGTEEGLYRYDGVSFQHFVHPDYSTDVSGLQQDTTGRIWCQNFSGQLFYVDNNELKLFYNYSQYENTFPTFLVRFPKIFATSSYGYLEIDFYSKKMKRNYINIDKKHFKINLIGDTLYQEIVSKIYNKGNDWYFSKDKEFWHLSENRKSNTKVMYHLTNSSNIVINNDAALIFSNTIDNGAVILKWISDQSLQEINLPPYLKNISAPSVLKDKNVYWLGLLDGLVILNENYIPIYGEKQMLEDKTISDVIRDNEGNYWIGTLNDGIYILTSKEVLIWNTENSPLLNNEITAITKDNDGNLYLLERKGKAWKLDSKTQKIDFLCDFKTQGKRLFFDNFHHVLYSQYGKKGFDIKHSRWKEFDKNSTVKDVSFLDENYFVYSTFRGVDIAHRDHIDFSLNDIWSKNNILPRTTKKERAFVLRNKRSANNCFDRIENRIWVGYTDGLYHYKDGNQREIRQNGNPILVSELATVKSGGIWVSTINKRILKIKNAKIIQEINIGETVLNIKEWKNFLFLGTNKGLIRYDLTNNDKEVFNTLDGFPSDNITGLEIVNEVLYITTNKGALKIPVTYSSINRVVPDISISQVAIWEKDTVLLPQYQLSSFNNNIKIVFKGRSIRSQGRFQYKYRMLGLDTTWVYSSSNNNVARFPSLPSGEYKFEVKSINEDGIESAEPATIQFIINYPYYLQWWFIILFVAFVAASIRGFLWLRINRIKKESELLNSQQRLKTELIQSQLTALRSQMNPHFMFNALNSIQEYTMTNQKELAVDYLGKFSDLMRLYLNHSRKETISLQAELDALELYLDLEQLRFEESLTCNIDIQEDIITAKVYIPSMLIQPYIENAIKHGLFHKKKNRKLSIKFYLQDNTTLYCSIKDNGIGREQSAKINLLRKNKPNSFATSAINNRLILLNQSRKNNIKAITKDVFNEHQAVAGTEVTIIIPDVFATTNW